MNMEWNQKRMQEKTVQKPINNYIVIFGFGRKILKIGNEFTESYQILRLYVVIGLENVNVPN